MAHVEASGLSAGELLRRAYFTPDLARRLYEMNGSSRYGRDLGPWEDVEGEPRSHYEAQARALAHDGTIRAGGGGKVTACPQEKFHGNPFVPDDATAVLALCDEVDRLREFIGSLGVNIGDEDDEWWRGYRQAQREIVLRARDALGGAS
jgi:hypothetical protein